MKSINFLHKNNNHHVTFSKIYNKYSNKLDGKIVKTTIINDSIETLFSMLFEYLLYEHIKQPNYLCKIYEIGKYNNNQNFFYSIMDNCGIDLYDFFQKIRNAKKKLEDEKNKNIEDKNKITEDKPHVVDMLERKEISLVINTTEGAQATKDSFSIRRTALMKGITYSTTISGARALVEAIEAYKNIDCQFEVRALQDLVS